MERIGVYPGTFDPVTNGHMDIVERGLSLVDRIVVAVAVNAGKGPLFDLDERVALLRAEIGDLPKDIRDHVVIRPFNSLLMHFVQEIGARVIVRGLRAISDFEYEFQMAGMNHRMNPQIETVFLMASETHTFIASRFVKEIARLGGDITPFVSARVAAAVVARYRSGAGAGEQHSNMIHPLDPKAPL
jgi:pantetheine-phosphate adenylyltransferase